MRIFLQHHLPTIKARGDKEGKIIMGEERVSE
jgi:hypothetical protein